MTRDNGMTDSGFGRGICAGMLMLGAVLMAGALSAAALPANATDTGDAAATAAGARALRLSSVEGQVRVIQDGQVIADPATDNLPLFAGSQVETGNDGRAEVQLEDGSVARLSPNTTLTFTVLDRQAAGTHTEIAVAGGLAYFEMQPSTVENSLKVVYGSAAFTATSFSVVRLNMDAAPGMLAVFSGSVELDRGSTQIEVHSGQSLNLNPADLGLYTLNDTIDPDSWDGWNADRDQALTDQSAEKTAATGDSANNQAMGMSDLDSNGNWYNVPGSGYVWSPYEAMSAGAGWDPYGFGNWVYYPRFGYVFVSGYGWGYAPYSCGLWNYYDSFGWGWAPGMGGCNPWWGLGGGGWGYNIGTYPRGYRPPRRPMPGPVQPRSGRPIQVHATIPVGQRPKVSPAPVTGRGVAPVVIAGHVVEPLRPLAPRQPYNPGSGATGTRPVSAGQGFAPGGKPTFIAHPAGPVTYPGPRPGTYPAPGQASGHPQPRPAPQQQSHPQSFGGGGGGGHPSAPSGGGGGHSSGGGSHK